MLALFFGALAALSLVSSHVAFAETLPWPRECAQVVTINHKGQLAYTYYLRSMLGGWEDVNKAIDELTGKNGAIVSPDYISYRSGHLAIATTQYSDRCNFADDKDDPYLSKIRDQTKAGPISPERLTGNRFVQVIQPLDSEEGRCLAISRKDGRTSGCGDQWQDGLSDSELACFKRRTYIRCQLECLETIYSRKIEYRKGACPDSDNDVLAASGGSNE